MHRADYKNRMYTRHNAQRNIWQFSWSSSLSLNDSRVDKSLDRIVDDIEQSESEGVLYQDSWLTIME